MNRFHKTNELLSDFFVLSVKFHNYHFNVKGREFKQTHLALEDAYNDFLDKFDELAEYLKMNDQMPFGTIDEYRQHSKIKEVQARDFSIEETYQMMKESYEYLIDALRSLHQIASKEDDFVLTNKLEDYIDQYLKAHWFAKATL